MADFRQRYGSILLAVAFTVLLALWMASGNSRADQQAQQELNNSATPPEIVMTVTAVQSRAERRQHEAEVYARTEALQILDIKARTPGVVERLGASQGEEVAKGQLLITLSEDDRPQRLVQAQATLNKAAADYKAKQRLAKKGYQSETQLAAAVADKAAAEAALKRIENEIEYTQIIAPFQGVLEQRAVEVGDLVNVGTRLARLMRTDRALVVGEVSENEVMTLRQGAKGYAVLNNGQRLDGRVAFVARQANAGTRTFRVELEVDTSDTHFVAGISARLVLPLEEVQVHIVDSGVLSLGASGDVGVKVVDTQGIVEFYAVEILKGAGNRLWLTGLPDSLRIITVGQGFVRPGDKVAVAAAKE